MLYLDFCGQYSRVNTNREGPIVARYVSKITKMNLRSPGDFWVNGITQGRTGSQPQVSSNKKKLRTKVVGFISGTTKIFHPNGLTYSALKMLK